jgi:GNAT superfamily N-acetyltransferase
MITYSTTHPLTPEAFIDVLKRSTLGERRPIDDPQAIAGMVANAGLTVTAWDGDKLVGVARSVTDFTYCCYLSDLAVDETYQRRGIGIELMARTQAELGPNCKLILLAAPAAADYYGHVGFEHHPRCWILDRDRRPGHPTASLTP